MILKRVTFSNNEKEDKGMSTGKKLAIAAGALGLAGLGGYLLHKRAKLNKCKKVDIEKFNTKKAYQDINNKQREIEEKKAKIIADLRTKKGWSNVEKAENEVNKELEKLQKTKTEVADDITDRHKLLQEKLDKLNKKTVDEYLPKKDQIKNTKELDDFMLK